MEPDLAARKRLGAEVKRARKRAGYAKTIEWVEKVGRSDRILLDLERGGKVGDGTYAAVAEALDWPLDRIYAILADEPFEAARSGPTELATVSNEELAAEVLRRLKRTGGEVGAEGEAATNEMTPERVALREALGKSEGPEPVGIPEKGEEEPA